MISRLAALGIATLAAVAQASEPIDLDNRQNFEALQRDRSEHFAKIQQILIQVQRQPAGDVASWMRTQFDARDVLYTDLLMTSLPAKKRLRFSLDRTSYVTTITLWEWDASPKPARSKNRP